MARTSQVTPSPKTVTIHKQPQVPPTAGRNQRVVKPPSPTNKGGIRNPFNRASRVGRGSAVSKRFGTKRGTK